MTSTLPRPTSAVSLQPQQTQNTAPVIEHRCLYTNDLRRKAKRWQDGILRFHTFNKRVMVYDVPRNYIGDTHWREEYPVQDGDEFELDRPVLVQVGEQVGSVEQDLTGLLGKRHKKDAAQESGPEPYSSSPSAPLIASGSRMGAVIPTHLRPKSLNALLGTPKGRIGRASLPVHSPYELRKGAESAKRIVEPHAKRQRVEMPTDSTRPAIEDLCESMDLFEKRVGKENTEIVGRSRCSKLHGDLRTDTQTQGLPRPIAKASLPLSDFTAITAPIRDGEARPGNPRRPSRKDHENENVPALEVAIANHRQHDQATKSKTRGKNPVSESESSKASAHKAFPEPLETIYLPLDSDKGTSHSNGQARPKTKLQMASRKPRRKLMYRDLLPQDAPATGNPSSSVVSNRESSGRDFMPERRAQRSTDPSSKQQRLDEQDGLELRLPNYHTRTRRRNEGCVLSSPEKPSHELDKPEESGIRRLSLSKHESERRHPKDVLNRSKSPSVGAVEAGIPKAVPSIHDTKLALARMDEILFSRSQPQKRTGQGKSQSIDDTSSVKRHATSLMAPEIPIPSAQETSETPEVLPLHGSPITQIPSSQFFETQIDLSSNVRPFCATDYNEDQSEMHPVKASVEESPSKSPAFLASSQTRSPSIVELSAGNPLDTAEASHTTSPAAKSDTMAASPLATTSVEDRSATLCKTSAPTVPAALGSDDTPRLQNIPGRVALNNPPATKAATGLPHFRPLRSTTIRQRSPIKKSVSDTSQTTSARPTSDVGNSGANVSNTSSTKEQTASPWSIEAWDLFGCGRDGVTVDFGTFRMHQGV